MRSFRYLVVAVLAWAAHLAVAQQASPGAADTGWWKNAVIYEIYPRSFGDTNGDGVGDLNGITAHLDYLGDLGVDAIWISPFYPSPQVDFGYDISDYLAIDPQYGTMADFDRLVAEAGKRRIRVITDLVLNHTSDRHGWFRESRASRTNPKADWYVWRDGKAGGQPPNNWISIFGHSAWQLDAARRQFYYHAFYKEQPDLNWRNPDVRKAMYDTMRFWMKRGVAGFRLDAVTSLFEDPQFRDETVRPGKTAYGDPNVSREHTDNLPEVHDVLREMRKVTDEFPGRILIGETYLPNVEELAKMYGKGNDETQLPMDMQFAMHRDFSAAVFRKKLREAETQLNGNLPLIVTDNHDNPRSWNRFGDGRHNEEIARLMATLLLTPRATALLYYGQELGMANNDPQRVEDVRDPIGKIGWPKEKGRDGERTPMQWDATATAGFTKGATPWLPVGADHAVRNVAAESRDPKSLLSYYKTLIRLRRENAALRDGLVKMVDESNPNVLSFLRQKDGTTVLVALNFSGQTQTVRYDLGAAKKLKKLVTSVAMGFATGDTAIADGLVLPAFGAYVGVAQ
ncbi:putative alpha-glucosidase [Candidatus Sulfopaludibacter sp. SbA4]|nr:putative alpha-glucosidase [Candidatus Sulfopaludibacter sp. SbA4]